MSLSVAPERAPNSDFGGRSFQGNSGDPSGFLGAPPGFPGAPNRVGAALSQPTILRDTPGRRSNATIQYACSVPVRTKLEKAQTKGLVHGELAFVYNNDSDATPLRTTGAGDKLTRLAAYTHMSARVALCKGAGAGAGAGAGSPGPAENVDRGAGTDLADLGLESRDVDAAVEVATERRYPDWVQAVEVYSNFQALPLALDTGSLEMNVASPLGSAAEECQVSDDRARVMRDASDAVGLPTGPGRKAYLHYAQRTGADGVPDLAQRYSGALASYLCVPRDPAEALAGLGKLGAGMGAAELYRDRTLGFLLSPFLMWHYGDDQPNFNWVADLGVADYNIASEDDSLGWGLTGVPRDLRVDLLAMMRDDVAAEGYFRGKDDNEVEKALAGLGDLRGGPPQQFYQEVYDNGEGDMPAGGRGAGTDPVDKRGRSGTQLRYADDHAMPQWEAYNLLIEQPLFDPDGGTCRFQPHGTIICRYVTDSDASVDSHMEAIENGLVNVCVQGHSMSAAFSGFASALRDSSRRARRLVTLPRDVMYIACVGRLNLGCVGHGPQVPNTLSEDGRMANGPLAGLSDKERAKRACIDHIRFERTTSEELRKNSQDRLSVTKGGFLRANEVILGAWRLGSVVDSAAARLKPAGGTSASNDPNNMSVTLSVGIRWVSSFELHEQFFTPPTDDPELDMNFDDGSFQAGVTARARILERRKTRLHALARRVRARAAEFAAELNRVAGETATPYAELAEADHNTIGKELEGLPQPRFGMSEAEAEKAEQAKQARAAKQAEEAEQAEPVAARP